MKTLATALAAALACCLATAGAAQAVKPKAGTWKVKLAGAPTPPGGRDGTLIVTAKKRKFTVSFGSPSHYVRCTGPSARPEEINPGFDGQFGLGGPFKVGKKGGFGGSGKFGTRTQSFSGKFTSKKAAKGTLRVRITGSGRTCDTGALKWKASKK